MGRYEQLNEQPVASGSDVDFLCFTDDRDLTSETWQIRYVRPLLPTDPTRSARALKIRAHSLLPEYDVSIYLDNSVVLLRTPEEALADLLPVDAPLVMVAHRFRETVRDEFAEVAHLGYDAPGRLEEQLAHYQLHDPESLDLRPLKTGILMIRRHHRLAVVQAMETWFAHVLRYSRRDQLSLWIALREAGLEPHVHELDNFESPYHRWPVTIDRDRDRGGIPWEPAEERLARLEIALANASLHVSELQQQISGMRSSLPWRWTKPLRQLRSRIPGRGPQPWDE